MEKARPSQHIALWDTVLCTVLSGSKFCQMLSMYLMQIDNHPTNRIHAESVLCSDIRSSHSTKTWSYRNMPMPEAQEVQLTCGSKKSLTSVQVWSHLNICKYKNLRTHAPSSRTWLLYAFQHERPRRRDEWPESRTPRWPRSSLQRLPAGEAPGKTTGSRRIRRGLQRRLAKPAALGRGMEIKNREREEEEEKERGSPEAWTIRQFQDHEALNQSRQGTLIKQPGPVPPTNPHRAIKSIPSKTLWNLSGENHRESASEREEKT